jgi:DNA-binding transcriptional ArsR family regulator
MNEYCEGEIKLARFAKALSHPARVHIMKLLSSHDSCFCGNIVDYLPLSQSTVSQHLKELKNSGLIYSHAEPPKIFYCVNKDNWLVAKTLFEEFLKIDFNKSCK